jgi:lambda family phage portal protein
MSAITAGRLLAPHLGWFERAIAFFAPNAALRRAASRISLDQLRGYEGAAHGRRVDGWFTRSTSANAELQRSLVKLRDRHRDLVRNVPWIFRAKAAVVSITIGFGITSRIVGNKTTQKRWNGWAGTTKCDADGRHNWYGLQALVWGAVVESGECIVRRRWRSASKKLAVPMQVQVLEADYLDHSKTVMLEGGYIIQGVEFNDDGERIAYWLFDQHPGELLGTVAVSKRVPAKDVLHIFRQDRPGQVRGVPWGAPIIITTRDLDELEDAFLMHEKISNAQQGWVRDIADVPTPANAPKESLSEAFEPGRIDVLPPGKDIVFNNPPIGRDISPVQRSYLLRIAAAYGITYAALTGDLTKVNFSSGRMGNIDMARNVEQWQWNTIVPQLLDPVITWFGEALAMTGMAVSDLAAEHGMPRREMINPVAEVEAYKEAIRTGLMPLSAAHRELGEDTDRVLDEYAETNKKVDQLGLKFDSDPRTDSAPRAAGAGARTREKSRASTTRKVA